MRIVIEINDNEYEGIKGYPDNITSYPVTIHLYDAVKRGTPLKNVIEELEHDKLKSRIRQKVRITNESGGTLF